MSATIGSRTITAMSFNGQSISSAWLGGQMVWSGPAPKDVVYERTFGPVAATSGPPLLGDYLAERGMALLTSPWYFGTRFGAIDAFVMALMSTYDGPVHFISNGEGAPTKAKEWDVGFSFPFQGTITGRTRIWNKTTEVGLYDSTGDTIVHLVIPADDESDRKWKLRVKRKDGGLFERSFDAKSITRSIRDPLGEVDIWRSAAGHLGVYLDKKRLISIDPSDLGKTVLANGIDMLPGAKMAKVTSRKNGNYIDCETMPFLKFIAAYSGQEARNRVVAWGMANKNGDPK